MAPLGSGGLGGRSCRQSSWRDTPYISWPDESVKQKESSEGSCSLSTGQKQKWASESGGDASGGYLCGRIDGGKWQRGDGRGVRAPAERAVASGRWANVRRCAAASRPSTELGEPHL
jgi:hypothetical protein